MSAQTTILLDDGWPDDDEPNLAECDYHQGVGYCSFGCHEEPACQTDGPWPDPDWPPMKWANMRGRRLGHQTAKWLGWVRTAMWLAEGRESDEPFRWRGEHDLSHLRRPSPSARTQETDPAPSRRPGSMT